MGDDEKNDLFKSLSKYGLEIQSAILNYITPSVKVLTQAVRDFEEKSLDLAKSFGVGRDRALEMKQSLADGFESIVKMGGSLSDTLEIAKDVGSSLNRNIILTKEAYSELYATAEVTGQGAGTLTQNFKDAGYSIYQISENMEKVVNTAVASGVNAKTVSREVVSNMSLMDKYNFDGGVEGLAKMATQATNLRISVQTIERAMSKAFEPEGAIEMAAALQRLGVSQSELLDPLRLMDLAQNDPAEFQNQIAEMSKTFVEFDEKTKSFQIAPGAKRQLQEVATAMGIPAGELAKMARASAELDDKLSKISFPDTFSDEQKQMIANMAEMGDGGEYIMRVNGEDLNIDQAMVKIQSMSEEERKKFLADSKPKSMEEIAKSQLTSTQSIDANIRSIAMGGLAPAAATSSAAEMAQTASIELTQALTDMLGGDAFKVKGVREGVIDKNVESISKGFESGDIIGTLGEIKGNLSEYIGMSVKQLGEGVDESFNKLKESSNPLIQGLTSLTEKSVDLIAKNENLSESFFKLNTNVDNTTEKLTKLNTTNVGSENVKAVLENTKTTTITPSTSTNEINFSTPLEIKISLSGLQAGMSEADLIRLFNEGKLNQIIEKAVAEAMKEKIGK